MTDTRAYRTDRHGFPVETCSRCCGRGNLPAYSNVFGGTCFKCQGAKVMYPTGKAGKIAAEFYAVLRTASRATLGAQHSMETHEATVGATVGDVVRRGDYEEWRTIASIRVTRRIVGESMIGHPYRTVAFNLVTVVAFTDGTVVEESSQGWQRKANTAALTALRDAKAAEARRIYEALLARRQRTAKAA